MDMQFNLISYHVSEDCGEECIKVKLTYTLVKWYLSQENWQDSETCLGNKFQRLDSLTSYTFI